MLQFENLRKILGAIPDRDIREAALADLSVIDATMKVMGTRLVAYHEAWPRDERGEFATQDYVDGLLKRPRIPEPQEVHWILAAWGVPAERFRDLTDGIGTRMIQESWECLLALMPDGQAADWMTRPNDHPLFQGRAPMEKLQEGQGGMAAIHHLLLGRMNNW